MLPAYYRFRVLNKTDQILTFANGARVTVKGIPWKMTAGAMAQGSAISDTTSILDTAETLDSNSAAAANTDFTLSGIVTSNLSYYFDANNCIACRVYQEAK
jgi:hypothetical protein